MDKMEDEECMVKIRGAYLRYGAEQVVLSGLNLTVRQREIYGLLGPSGCGKTTILSCIVGRTRLDGGQITVAVDKRADIGYMPQETALFPEFTMKEIFIFYGRLFGLSLTKTTKRAYELCNLLQLPDWNNTIGSLSGGQQRRTSFAVAMLHDPKLLILDEPTVGVDSLLAHSMWEYLEKLTTNEGKTIIITTHYIEEAKHCNTVSLMRGGVLLSEGSPSQLLISQNCSNLEEAFLELSKKQELKLKEEGSNIPDKCLLFRMSTSPPPLQNDDIFNGHRFTAQLIKNVCWMQRNVPIMFFLLLLPALQSFLFCASFGQDPRGLNVGFVSDELITNEHMNDCNNISEYHLSVELTSETCTLAAPFTCEYIQELNSKMNLVLYDTLEFAELEALRNRVWGVVHLSSNFTQAIIERVKYRATDWDLDYGTVSVKMDMSNYFIAQLLKRDITESLLNALKKYFVNCNFHNLTTGIKVNDAVFGNNNPIYAHSGLPGFICSFCFYFTMMFTSGAVMMEKIIGLLERSMVAGMTHFEIVGAHLVVQFLLMAAQTAIMLIVFYVFYSNPFLGDIKLIIALLFAIETVGISYGFLLTEIFATDRMVSYAGIGTTLAVFSLGGIIWPIQGAHIAIRSCVWAFPVAPAVESYNSITSKGYTMSHQAVYNGFLSCIFWTLAFAFIALFIARMKQLHKLPISKKLA